MKPKLLFLCQTLPYPPDGGVSIRSYNILRLLSYRYDVSAVCFYRRAVARDVQSSLLKLREMVDVETFPIEQEFSGRRLLWDHLRSVIGGRVYTVPSYESAGFRARVRQLVRSNDFSLVHMDSLDLSAYLPEVAGIPTVVVHHNVESALLRRRAGVESNALKSAYLRLQSRLMLREERRSQSHIDLHVMVSKDDESVFHRLVPDARTAVIPNGVDVDTFRPADCEQKGVVFVGGMTWFPNKDALEYFAGDVMPVIREARPSERVTWVGRALEGAATHYAPMGVDLTGYVDDIRPFVQSAAVYVVPLRVGGGTRLKILDAWAMGKAVVSTSIGCEGLDAKDGENILIRDDPRSFAAAVNLLLADGQLRTRIGEGARRTAEAEYSWVGIGERMYAHYEAVRSAGGSDRRG